MRSSRYNMFIGAKELGSDTIVYNTFSGAIYTLDPAVTSALNALPLDSSQIPATILRQLLKDRIVVPDDCDELALVREEQQRLKYRSGKAVYMVVVTYGCNLACPYCYESTKQGRLNGRNLENVIKFMKKQAELHGCREVDLEIFGGEPLLCPDVSGRLVDEMEEWCAARDTTCRTIVYTNGTIFNSEVQHALGHRQFRYTQISIDGQQGDHDRTRRHHDGTGSYSTIIQNIPRMIKAGMKPVVRINVDRANCGRTVELMDDMVKRGLNETVPIGFGIIRPMTPICTSYGESLDDEQLANLLPDLWSAALDRGFKLSLKPKRAFVYCSAFLNSSYVIDTSADVYKCSGLVGLPSHRIGHIDDNGDLTGATEVYGRWMQRDPLTQDACRSCVSLPVCGGGCGGTTATVYGTYEAFDCFDRARDMVAKRIMLHLRSSFPDRFGDLKMSFKFLNFDGPAPRPSNPDPLVKFTADGPISRYRDTRVQSSSLVVLQDRPMRAGCTRTGGCS